MTIGIVHNLLVDGKVINDKSRQVLAEIENVQPVGEMKY